ncbi:MAG: aspartate aminotransferase family protein [Promethearchaeota archaeon]
MEGNIILDAEFKELHFQEAPKILTEVPGPKSRAILEKQKFLDSNVVSYPLTYRFALEAGKGATLMDVDGNIYIDFSAGVSVCNVGYSNPEVLKVVKNQADKIIHTLDIPTQARIDILEALSKIAPGNMKGNSRVVFGGPTGSDAVEAAIKLAKVNKKGYRIITFEGGYHGQTSGSLAATAKKSYKENYMPLIPGIVHLPYPYCYRCPFGKEADVCGMECLRYIEHLFDDPYSGLVQPAGMIVEPIQGESGIIVPPKEFIQGLAKLCQENDLLLVCDEIQAGLGRTGRWWGCEHFDVTPDAITMAKSIGGIGFPLAGMIYKKEFDVWGPGDHAGTFRGNVLGCAAGAAAIKFTEEKQLVKRSAELGDYALKKLQDLKDEVSCIGDVRGKGLFLGVEFVENKDTKKPAEDLLKKVVAKCLEHGVIVWKGGHWINVARFIPALTITKELLDKGLEIFSEIVKELDKTI